MAYQAKLFDEGLVNLLSGDYDPTDAIKLAIVTSAVTPTTTQVAPKLTDFTEVSDAGTYTLGGADLGLLGNLISTAGGVITFDSTTNPSWAQDVSNGTDARWGIIYNNTSVDKQAIGYVDLNTSINMALGTLTITWATTGIARFQRGA